MAISPNTIKKLTERRQFLRVARGYYQARRYLVVQGRKASPATNTIRIGFTATKKTGNAVRRNRAKRRLRAACQQVLPTFGRSGWDYVFIARKQTAQANWNHLLDDMKAALLSLRDQGEPTPAELQIEQQK